MRLMEFAAQRRDWGASYSTTAETKKAGHITVAPAASLRPLLLESMGSWQSQPLFPGCFCG
jgi:hypothetical protein